MRRGPTSGILLACLSAACMRPAPAERTIDLAAEEQAIREQTAAIFAAEAARDMDGFLAHFSPEVVVQPEGAPTIVGTEALRAMQEAFYELPYTDFAMEPRRVVVAASGDLAYDIGPWRIAFDGDEGPTEARGKSTLVWKRSDDRWRIVLMSFSMDSRPGPSTE